MISTSASGFLVSSLAAKMPTAETAAAYMNHLSYSRSSWPDRRKRTTTETAPTRNTSGPSPVDRL